jgi:hypothetical protein
MKTSTYYLLGAGAAVGTALFLILAIGALGIIGDGGRDDRMYLAVPAVLVLGTIVARLRAPGMSLALLATAVTQVLVTVVALVAGVPEEASIVDILGINAMYAALFCLSAWLFRRAAEQDSPVVFAE